MKNITTATEKAIKEMMKNNNQYAKELEYLLNQMKCREGYYGASINEMKNSGLTLDNQSQIGCIVTNLLRGMGYRFSKYINVVDCLDLHYVNIDNFNELVKACKEDIESRF